MENKMWLVYAVLAGLCWGTYVPFVQQGIQGLGRSPMGNFLCVGIAYFVIAVLFPMAMFMSGERTPDWNIYGISFATLAGVAGALGALCVIFANRSAGADFRLYIGPIIFALAPLLNTVISLFWHPSRQSGVFQFHLHEPHWTLYLGIVLTGLGAALVLYSKELSERPSAAPAVQSTHAQLSPPIPPQSDTRIEAHRDGQ
jgi:drug/metabolite transporter (DMT)-like permease